MTEAGVIPRLHVVTDDRILARRGFEDLASSVLETGGRAVALHIRGPGTPGARLFELASVLADPAERSGSLLVVNDRVDVAMAVRLSAVHLGVRSIPVPAARTLLGSGSLVGRSVHDGPELDAAFEEGADYVMLGNVYETPSHPGRRGLGTQAVAALVRRAGAVPVLAIGGIAPERVVDLVPTGVHGIGALGGVWDHPDPAEAVSRYISTLGER